MTAAIIIILATLFMVDNQEFFDTATEQMDNGAEWEYVGPQSLDPTAKSISIQVEGEEPYIVWKLKKPE